MGATSRSLTDRLRLRGFCALGLVLLLCGLLPVSAARGQPATPVGMALYYCTTGLCVITIGSDKAQTVIAFDPKATSIHGYALALDGAKIVYALGDTGGASGAADIYMADADGKNARKLFSIKGAENGVGDLEGYGVLGLTADNRRLIFEDNAQVFTANLDGSDRRPVLKQFMYGASSSHYYQLSPKRTRLLVTYSDTIPYVSEYDIATGQPYGYDIDLSLTPAAMGSDENRIFAYRLGRPYNPNAQSRGENMEIPVVGYAEVELPSLKSRPIEIPGAIMSSASNGQMVLAQTTQTYGEYKDFQLFDIASGKLTLITMPNFVAFGERTFNNISLVFPASTAPPPAQLNLAGEIAYVKDGDIWLLDISTKQSKQLTQTGGIDSRLSWSPDGKTIAFAKYIQALIVLYTIQADGTNLQKLSSSPDTLLPTFSPSGSLFMLRDQGEGIDRKTVVVKRSPSGVETIVEGVAGGGLAPATELRVFSDTRFAVTTPNTDSSVNIRLVDLGTGQPKVDDLTEHYLRPVQGACTSVPSPAYFAVWAHAKPLLAYLGNSTCESGGQGSQVGIYVLDPDSANPTPVQIVTSDSYIQSVDWSSDDQWLVFQKDGGLWIVSAQGGSPQQLLAAAEAPAWRPGSAIDKVSAQKWLDEKDLLIKSLESVNVDTTLFAFPNLPAYDEKIARELWMRTKTQLQDGTITPEQLEAFARLTLQERSFSKLLPVYTTVAAAHSTTLVDTLEVGVGTVFALKPAWNICKKALPFCGRLQSSTEDIVWRVMEDAGTTFSTFVGPTHEDREAGAHNWQQGLALVQDGFRKREDNPEAILEMIRDTSIESSVTGAVIQPYLGRTRSLLAKGIRTADLATSGGDRWLITGTTQRAEVNIDLLNDQLAIEQETALSNYQAFQKGAGILKIAEDVADWATLSPLVLIAKAVGIGARIEHIVIVSVPLTYLNLKSLDCIEYLSGRASERAFDADHTFC